MFKVITDKNKIKEVLDRRFHSNSDQDQRYGLYPSRENIESRLTSGERLSFYYGIDPTGPEIHLGHTAQLLLLKDLAKLGHEAIILIGDFTAKIGDPTGKDKTRTPLSSEEISWNMKNYIAQIKKVMEDTDFKVKYNSDWLAKLGLEDIIKLASNLTVQQVIARDMFQERIKNEKPIGVHEFIYPLLQGYDSVAMRIDGEIGGNDQTFNMLVGRDLEMKLIGKDKMVLATPLFVSAETGKKLSKSEGTLISVTDSADDIFGKTMRYVPDNMIKTIFKLCTEVSEDKIEEFEKLPPRDFKEKLALELTTMYYSKEKANKAKDEFVKISKKEVPENVKEFSGEGVSIVDILIGSDIVKSNSEAKRLIEQRAVSINGKVIDSWDIKLKKGDMVRSGPINFIKII